MDFYELRNKLKLKEDKYPNITNVWKQYRFKYQKINTI